MKLRVENFGRAVFGDNGMETELCFDRRFHPEVNVQAYFTNVKGCIEEDEWRVNFICGQEGFDFFSSDNLFLFERSMDDDDIEASVKTWMEFLKPLLQDELEWDLVASTLVEEGRGTRTVPSSQESKVYNYEEVTEELTEISKWEGFLHN